MDIKQKKELRERSKNTEKVDLILWIFIALLLWYFMLYEKL